MRKTYKHQGGIGAVGTVVVFLIFCLLVLVSLVVISRIKNSRSVTQTTQDTTTQNQDSEVTLKGISLSPKSYEAEDFTNFLKTVNQNGSVLTWAGKWTDLQSGVGAPFTIVKLGVNYEYTPIVITGSDSWNAGDQEAFVSTVKDFASQYQPSYLGLGNEVNILNEKSTEQYQLFIQFFNNAVSAVHQVSPDTKVFVVFQYEKLNGLKGGLFGGVSDESKNDWRLLDDFSNADIIAFTTYPYIIFNNPSDIPEDYYSRIRTHTNKPTAFTELGWPSETVTTGYESTPQVQADFITHFADLTRELKAKFVIWPFLYDQNIQKPFDTDGLIDSAGNPKPALNVWRGISL